MELMVYVLSRKCGITCMYFSGFDLQSIHLWSGEATVQVVWQWRSQGMLVVFRSWFDIQIIIQIPAVIHPIIGIDIFYRTSDMGECAGPMSGQHMNPNFVKLNNGKGDFKNSISKTNLGKPMDLPSPRCQTSYFMIWNYLFSAMTSLCRRRELWHHLCMFSRRSIILNRISSDWKWNIWMKCWDQSWREKTRLFRCRKRIRKQGKSLKRPVRHCISRFLFRWYLGFRSQWFLERSQWSSKRSPWGLHMQILSNQQVKKLLQKAHWNAKHPVDIT